MQTIEKEVQRPEEHPEEHRSSNERIHHSKETKTFEETSKRYTTTVKMNGVKKDIIKEAVSPIH